MSKNSNVKDQFLELLERNSITGRITTNIRETSDNPTRTEICFNDISVSNRTAIFYDDPDNNRAECTGAFHIDLGQIDRVIYHKDLLGLECLYGLYDALISFKNNTQTLITFNTNNGEVPKQWETAVEKRQTIYNNDYEAFQDEQQSLIDAILSHKGSFLINVNGGDFVEEEAGFGIEVFNLVFTSVEQFRSKELLSFNNSETKPISYTDKNVPVYPMGVTSVFYIKIDDITLIEEMKVEDYADVFEYPSQRIFNIHMNNESIITIGLY